MIHRMITSRFKRIGERFNIKTGFKAKYTLGNFLRKIKLNTDTLERPEFHVNVVENTLVKGN
jgi:hypothetical protein